MAAAQGRLAINYWMVNFESYAGHGNAVAWFETKEAAQKVYETAVRQMNDALREYREFGRDQTWVGTWFQVEDCFGTKFAVNLANHVIALSSTDASGEGQWKIFRANKDADNKYKPLYDEGTKMGIKP